MIFRTVVQLRIYPEEIAQDPLRVKNAFCNLTSQFQLPAKLLLQQLLIAPPTNYQVSGEQLAKIIFCFVCRIVNFRNINRMQEFSVVFKNIGNSHFDADLYIEVETNSHLYADLGLGAVLIWHMVKLKNYCCQHLDSLELVQIFNRDEGIIQSKLISERGRIVVADESFIQEIEIPDVYLDTDEEDDEEEDSEFTIESEIDYRVSMEDLSDFETWISGVSLIEEQSFESNFQFNQSF